MNSQSSYVKWDLMSLVLKEAKSKRKGPGVGEVTLQKGQCRLESLEH